MPISLIAVDMDGTFLRPDMTYDRGHFLSLRNRMRQSGIPFVVASGNQYWQLKSFFEPEDGPAFVAENGHFIYDAGAADPFYVAPSRPRASRKLVRALEDERIPYLLSTESGGVVPSWEKKEDLTWWSLFYHRFQVVGTPEKFSGEVIKAAVLTPDPEGLSINLRSLLGTDFDPVVSGPQDMDINAPGHNKATGLEKLAKRWNIDLGNAVAFGDSYNDLEMLQVVGTSVAMANAPGDVRSIASKVAPSNSEDGVLKVLDELLGC